MIWLFFEIIKNKRREIKDNKSIHWVTAYNWTYNISDNITTNTHYLYCNVQHVSVYPVCSRELKKIKIKDEWLSNFLQHTNIIKSLDFDRMFENNWKRVVVNGKIESYVERYLLSKMFELCYCHSRMFYKILALFSIN